MVLELVENTVRVHNEVAGNFREHCRAVDPQPDGVVLEPRRNVAYPLHRVSRKAVRALGKFGLRIHVRIIFRAPHGMIAQHVDEQYVRRVRLPLVELLLPHRMLHLRPLTSLEAEHHQLVIHSSNVCTTSAM